MNLKKSGKVFTSKFVGTGLSSYEKRIYRATVSQRLRNAGLMYAGMDLLYNSYFKLDMKVNYRQKLCEYRDMVLWVVTL